MDPKEGIFVFKAKMTQTKRINGIHIKTPKNDVANVKDSIYVKSLASTKTWQNLL